MRISSRINKLKAGVILLDSTLNLFPIEFKFLAFTQAFHFELNYQTKTKSVITHINEVYLRIIKVFLSENYLAISIKLVCCI